MTDTENDFRSVVESAASRYQNSKHLYTVALNNLIAAAALLDSLSDDKETGFLYQMIEIFPEGYNKWQQRVTKLAKLLAEEMK